MRTVRCLGLLVVILLAGCARDKDYLDVLDEQQAAWNGVADVLETVKDAKSMADAKADLQTRLDRCDAIAKKAQALPRPAPEVLEKNDNKVYRLKLAMERTVDEVRRMRALPGGEAFFRQLDSTAQRLISGVKT